MGRPKGSKNKSKSDNVVQIGGEPPHPTMQGVQAQTEEGPPDRLAAAREELESEQASVKGQQYFDGLAPVRHQAIDEANDVWRGWDAKSREASEKKKEARQHVLQKMKDHNLTYYKTLDGWILERKEDEKVKARRADGESVEDVSYSGAINPDGGEDEDGENDVDTNLDIDAPIDGEQAAGTIDESAA